MSDDSNGTPPEEESNGPPKEKSPEPMDLKEAERLVREAQARGEDPLPILRRIVLSTIDELAKRVPRAPGQDS